jgi:O-antigen/teichoic acid export membrane protein
VELAAPVDSVAVRLGQPRLARHSVYNLVGQGAPLVAAFFSIPILVRELGTDRFGVLTLAWMVIGYFSLFDLGLGRALTQLVAATVSKRDDSHAPPLVWPALAIMTTSGLLGALAMSVIAPWLVYSVLKIPASLRAETLNAFYLLAVGIPIVVVTAAYVGILSAFHRFGVLNAIRAPMGIFTFLAPLAVLPFSRSLVAVTAALVAGRLLACAAHVVICQPLMPPLRGAFESGVADIRSLFKFGVWMSVSNVIGPMLVYLDRFVIGGILSVSAVAYYATPYEMVTKLLIIPNAFLGVLFPAFAASYRHDNERLVRLFARGTKYTALVMFPLALLVVAFAQDGLRLWLGDEFARNGMRVLQVLAVGVFINSVAQVFASLVQGVGRPDLTAKLHVLELPFYLIVLWWAVHHYGIVGAAVAWTARVLVDGVLLFLMASRFLGKRPGLIKRTAVGLMVAMAALVVPLLLDGRWPRLLAVCMIVVVMVPSVWYLGLADDERGSVLALVSRS